MDEKNYTEVLINGNVYTLGGAEDPEYLQKVAAYINEKIAVLKAQPGFTRQNKDYQEVMIYLNLADDYFKAKNQAERLTAELEKKERELYSVRHDLIEAQLEIENLKKEKKAGSGQNNRRNEQHEGKQNNAVNAANNGNQKNGNNTQR